MTSHTCSRVYVCSSSVEQKYINTWITCHKNLNKGAKNDVDEINESGVADSKEWTKDTVIAIRLMLWTHTILGLDLESRYIYKDLTGNNFTSVQYIHNSSITVKNQATTKSMKLMISVYLIIRYTSELLIKPYLSTSSRRALIMYIIYITKYERPGTKFTECFNFSIYKNRIEVSITLFV